MPTKLGDMTSAGALAGTELVYVQVGTASGDERQSTVDALKTYTLADFSANGLSLGAAANYAAMRALLDLEAGTDFNAYSANLAGLSALGTLGLIERTGSGTYATHTISANVVTFLGAADYAAMRTQLGLVIGTNVQAYHARLADIAGITYAQGDVLYYDGANLVKLAAGTSGHFLKTQGAGANPTWALPSGGTIADADYGDVAVSSSGTVFTIENINYSATVTASGTPPVNAVGYLGAPQMSDQDDYTLVMADAGKHYYHVSGSTHTLTIPANASVAFPIGTVIVIVNESGGGNLSIAITSDTLRWGSSTGTRTLAANGTATLLKVTATVWRLTGDGIT